MLVACFQCGQGTEVSGSVARSDTCGPCRADLHVCFNCEFYDASAYNECREPQAERTLIKDRANFCDYFKPRSRGATSRVSTQEEMKKQWEALFKKKV